MIQQAFQFSYDPLFKRFSRELRDQENKDFLLDKFFLGLKLKKDDARQEAPQDPNAYRYTNMSYIGFLNRQQRMIERGVLVDDFEDDEEGQSEDESEGADENDKTKTKTPAGKNEVTPINGGKATGVNG